MDSKIGIKYLLMVIFATLGLFISGENLDKFINQDTTYSSKSETYSEVSAPSVTICASEPYKKSITTAKNTQMSSMYHKDQQIFKNWPSLPSEVALEWKKKTFDISEIVTSITIINNDTCTEILSNIDDLSRRGNFYEKALQCNLNIKEINSLTNGRCYNVEFAKKAKTDDPVEILLKFPATKDQAHGQPRIFIHPQFHEISIPLNVWKITPLEKVLPMLKQSEVMVTSTLMKANKNIKFLCNEEMAVQNYTACFASEISKRIFDLNFKKSICKLGKLQNAKIQIQNCTIPQAEFFTPNVKNSQYCTDGQNAGCVMEVIHQSEKHFMDKGFQNCEMPCQIMDYTYSTSSSMAVDEEDDQNPQTLMYFKMENTEVTINEETLFFDLNSIIGAIGGCMSLFVGFSLKDFILDALDILLAIRKRCCKKKAPKTPKISK